ncbi:aminodeoxychorismate synthase component I [Oxalicibacterium solurbis]|uniref:Para-aminobenzoate synthase n=1 Tax=Oxalicibacterium solurbis TaxID=69280 RepID=A0A8J3AZG0_9BURK|nr:aminodeoxychorismate synthase component I [Oxalicibacterium solurbis]GGI53832.1 para-aminobenzoate synthase [Oxalicibacterium solurbis]
MFLPADTGSYDCFALLDDCETGGQDGHSRLYSEYVGTLVCDDHAQLPAVLEEMQQKLREGCFAVGLFSYELGEAMHGIALREEDLNADANAESHAMAGLAEVLLFRRREKLRAAQVNAWLQARVDAGAASQPAGVANVHADIDRAAFDAALARIRDYIEAGDTYQVNYTYRLRFDAYGDALALYRRLRTRQPVPYGALIGLPDGRAVLSLSPELFVRHDGGSLTVRPMKGTAAASGDAARDAQAADALANDPKNRAENLMIVDLLRNDLGRVAATGSVVAEKLFDVQRFSSVLQMTSTITAKLRSDASLADVFVALYPCGSITGAPKHRTMQIIRELEAHARGLYTGAIGWFDPPPAGQNIGDFCMSVPIRTLQLGALQKEGIRHGELGVGAGIVHDSIAKLEYEECLLKAHFLTGLEAGFALFETMRATRDGCRHLERHLQRLCRSAGYFGFIFDEAAIRSAVQKTIAGFDADTDYRMRLALQQDGTIEMQTAPLKALSTPVRLLLTEQETQANDLFLRHKTTNRTVYDEAWRDAERQGAFDKLFCNTHGEVTEGGRSNVFVRLDGQWFTPPLATGVLPGVMRGVMLDDPQWNAKERVLTMDDLRRAEEIVVCNALRGALPATIVWC